MQLIAVEFAAGINVSINISTEMIIKACKNLDFIWIDCRRIAYTKAIQEIQSNTLI